MIAFEKLMAYADGELSGAERDAVEAAIARDPALAAQVEAQRALKARLARAFAPIAAEPPPQRLVDAVRAKPQAEIVDLSARRKARAVVAQFAALAACFAAGLFVGVAALRGSGPIGVERGALIARGELAEALTIQLASEARADADIRIGLTFAAQDGALCRTFSSAAAEGIACRDGETWRLDLLAAPARQGEYRMASSPLVLEAVSARIKGEPLDAAGERAARDAGWRAAR